jgi:site-specific DNA-methyltransferase (adenine-specific)
MFELNTIYNESCLETMKHISDNEINLILTDIPYNAVNRNDNGLRNLNKEDADILTFDLSEFLQQLIRICSGSGYIFCGWGQISQITDFFINNGLSTRLCVWKKTNPSPMNGEYIWLSGAEFAVYFKKHNATFNEHCKNCVWDFPSGKSTIHPTEKPIALFEYLVQVSSNVGDIVYDPCIGSGTTAVACKELDRNYVGSEISPEYCKIAEERIKNLPTKLL